MIRASPFTLAALAAWCALLAVWIPGRFAAVGRPRMPQQTAHRALQFAATALLFISFILLFGRAVPAPRVRFTPPEPVLGTLGAALTIAGVAFAIWARRALGRNWSGLVMRVREGHELVQSGPYAVVRHPIYTGIALAMLGTALTIGTLQAWLGVAAGFCGILVRVTIEERLMAAEFGATHAAYRERTKKLVPFVW